MASVGGVRSMLNGSLVTEAMCPAASVAVPLTVRPTPSTATTWSGGQVATPAPASAQVKCAVTSPFLHPFAFAPGDNDTVTAGGDRSIPNGALVMVVVFPAKSVTLPETRNPLPSSENV